MRVGSDVHAAARIPSKKMTDKPAEPRILSQIVPGGANEDEIRQEQRREKLGLTHEQMQRELLEYLTGAGVTLETLERWTIERGHMQGVVRRLAERVVTLQAEINSLHLASQQYDNVLGQLGKLLGLPSAKKNS